MQENLIKPVDTVKHLRNTDYMSIVFAYVHCGIHTFRQQHDQGQNGRNRVSLSCQLFFSRIFEIGLMVLHEIKIHRKYSSISDRGWIRETASHPVPGPFSDTHYFNKYTNQKNSRTTDETKNADNKGRKTVSHTKHPRGPTQSQPVRPSSRDWVFLLILASHLLRPGHRNIICISHHFSRSAPSCRCICVAGRD